jgi:hypothetical protein
MQYPSVDNPSSCGGMVMCWADPPAKETYEDFSTSELLVRRVTDLAGEVVALRVSCLSSIGEIFHFYRHF